MDKREIAGAMAMRVVDRLQPVDIDEEHGGAVAVTRNLLGDALTVLDLYVTVVSRWGPRRVRFYDVAPRMSEVVRRVDADPRLAEFWPKRFPFFDGWERLGQQT